MDIKDTEEYKSTRDLLNKITMKQETLEELAKDFYSDENQLMERIAFKRGYTECKEK